MAEPLDNSRAALLMVVSMALFTLEDGIIKWATTDLPVGQILLMLGGIGTAVLWAYARLKGAAVFGRDLLLPGVMARNLAEIVGAVAFVTALASNPLSLASALLQALPLVATAGAALFLGETVGWRRWAAIGVGLAGTLVILRPGTEAFRPEALWVLLCVAALTVRDLATRAAPARLTTPQFVTWGFAATALAGALLLALDRGAPPVVPSAAAGLAMAAAAGFGIAGYSALMVAVRGGDVAVVAPFRYARVVFGILLGMAAFGERPDGWMLAGVALVVGSGLYTLARETRLRRRNAIAMQPAAGASPGPSPAPPPPL